MPQGFAVVLIIVTNYICHREAGCGKGVPCLGGFSLRTLDSADGHTMLFPPSSLQLCLCAGLARSVHRQTQPSARLPGRENRKLEPDGKQEPSVLLGTEFSSNTQGRGSSRLFPLISLFRFLSSGDVTLSFTVSPFPITVSICLNVPLTSAQKPALPIPTSEIEFLRFIPQITEQV